MYAARKRHEQELSGLADGMYHVGTLSTADPMPDDLARTRELEATLRRRGLFEAPLESQRREQVLGRLDHLCKDWVKRCTARKGMGEQMVMEANTKLFTFGSYRLGVHGPGADIDTLCVGPRHITREEDFFTHFLALLEGLPEVTELQPVPDSFVPVIKMKFDGVSIDLLYASLHLPRIDDTLDLTDDNVLRHADDKTVRSLNGTRVTDMILRLVPNIPTFRLALRCLKVWAKERGVYSNVTGFLAGISLALTTARICQLYPRACASMVVEKYFKVYANWSFRWTNPILLRPLQTESPAGLMLQVWDPRVNYRDKMHLMPVVTPAYPSMNSMYNVNENTLRIMLGEFKRGAEVSDLLIRGEATWDGLLEECPFFEMYNHYLRIDVVAGSEAEHVLWSGWCESRLRQITLKIEKTPALQLMLHPNPRDFEAPDVGPHATAYFIGLSKAEQTAEEKADADAAAGGNVVDLRTIVTEFIQQVKSWDRCTAAMDIRVSHIKQRKLPLFVFKDGKRPAKKPKKAPAVAPSADADGQAPAAAAGAASGDDVVGKKRGRSEEAGAGAGDATAGTPPAGEGSGRATAEAGAEAKAKAEAEPAAVEEDPEAAEARERAEAEAAAAAAAAAEAAEAEEQARKVAAARTALGDDLLDGAPPSKKPLFSAVAAGVQPGDAPRAPAPKRPVVTLGSKRPKQ